MYNRMSEIYDQLMMEEVDYQEWIRYIERIFRKYKVTVKNILDLGCGTGNITIPLSDKGYDMTGIDLSEEMLSIADNKAFENSKNIKWIYGDMTNIQFGCNYDAIISCCDSVNYVLNDTELQSMFHNAYQALTTDGIFTFDIHSFYNLNEIYRDEVFTYTSDEISYIWENNYDDRTDIIEYYINLFIKNDRNECYTRAEEIHYQRAYQSEDVVQFLNLAGFEKVEIFQFNTFDVPSLKSERLQFCCRP